MSPAWVATVLILTWCGTQVRALAPGSGIFVWRDATGGSDPDKIVEVHYFRPAAVHAASPVWIIMHGTHENPDDYRDHFVDSGRRQGALVVAPKMVPAHSDEYELGNVSVSQYDATPRGRLHWAFSKIEPLFDHVLSLESAIRAEHYFMFGHSGGAQFGHRFLMWVPEARCRLAVVANAGWYTLPQFRDPSYPFDWPYTLSNVPDMGPGSGGRQFPVENLVNALGRRMVVMLGSEDIKDHHHQTEGAVAQGWSRFERGKFFFEHAKAEAAARGVYFGWHLQIVEGIDHNSTLMAIPAAEVFRLANIEARRGRGRWERVERGWEGAERLEAGGSAMGLSQRVVLVVVVAVMVGASVLYIRRQRRGVMKRRGSLST